jgi:hypothetical protein
MHDRPTYRQTKSIPSGVHVSRSVNTIEPIEYPFEVLRGNPDARVGYSHAARLPDES